MIKTIFRTFLLGLGVGVLVAPRPGSETRQMLTERFNRLFGSQDSGSTASEWDRPLSDATASVTPSQHYVEPSVSSPAATTTYGTTSGTSSTTLADTDIGGAANI